MKFDGSVWSNVGNQGFFKSQATYVGLAAIESGLAACMVNNHASSAIPRRTMGVATWDGSAWTTDESSLLPAGQQMYTCKMGDNGKIATLISINRGKVSDINYGHNILKYENGNWESLLNNFVEPNAAQTSIAVGTFGTKVASDGTIYALKQAAILCKQLAGGKISMQICDEYPLLVVNEPLCLVEYQQDDSMSRGIYRQVAIDPEGMLFVAFNNYKDQQKLYVMYLDPNTNQWTTPQQLAEDADDINIDFAADGTGYITFTASNKVHMFKYDYVDATGIKTVVNHGVAGETYYNLSGVRVATPTTGVFIKRTVDTNGKVTTQKILKK